jgi:hypothetical protein
VDIDWRTILSVLSLAVVTLSLAACTVLGTGRSTLVLAEPTPSSPYTGTDFDHLIAGNGRKLVGMQGRSAASEAAWEAFRQSRFGSTTATAARIDINVRDQTNTPSLDFFNIETVTAADVAKILTDHSLGAEQKDALLTQLRDNFRGMPESYSRLVSHGTDTNGGLIYYYFPQVTIDLTGTLNTAETLDRFDFIAAAIRIPADNKIRFINFSPKAADLFDFTLGQFKESASATASATAGRKTSDTSSATAKPTGGPETTTGTSGGLDLGGALSFSLSDELTRDLKSSLEARSAGILDGGKLFLVELRSNDMKRIAGTYTFNVMLEVPSTVSKTVNGPQTIWSSDPVETSVNAEVRVVGIVRHVVRPGKTGTFKRVPEPLNDETFREVVLHDGTAPLWTFTNVPTAQIANDVNLTIYTNDSGASFTVYDEKTGAVLGHGTGSEAHFAIETKNKVKVVFHPVIVGGDKPSALTAADVTGLTVTKDMTAIGSYTPKN